MRSQERKKETPQPCGGGGARDRVGFTSEHEKNKAMCQKVILV